MAETARQRQRLIEALEDARDGMEDMIGYVPDHFVQKWDHQDYIDRAEAALREFEEDE